MLAHGTRLLFLLLFARLLMPPGVCVCKYEAPALHVLAGLLGGEPAPPAQEPADDDHDPGCPASFLATGLGLAPAPGPALHLPADLPSLTAGPVEPAPTTALPFPPTPSDPPGDPPLFLSHCALLV